MKNIRFDIEGPQPEKKTKKKGAKKNELSKRMQARLQQREKGGPGYRQLFWPYRIFLERSRLYIFYDKNIYFYIFCINEK